MFKYLYHYFIPHRGNNHRSKIIHNSSLLVLVVMLLFSSWVSVLINKTNPQILGIAYSISDQELLILVNEKRLENGLSPVKLNEKLTLAASEKAKHMLDNNYWAHFAPDSTSPWKFIIDSEYDYIYAGENLAKGFVNSADAVNAWMNSSSHRDNILSDQYEDIGFAVIEGSLQGEETILIVELFGKERNQFIVSDISNIEATLSISSTNDINESSAGANELVEVLLGAANINNIVSDTSFEPNLYQSKPLIDLVTSAKTLSFILTVVLLIAFILDLIIIIKKKIPRIVGDNLDHILLLSIFIVFMFIYNLGKVL